MLLTFIGLKKNQIIEVSVRIEKEEMEKMDGEQINQIKKNCINALKKKVKPLLFINVVFDKQKVFIENVKNFDSKQILKNYE